MGNRKYSIPPDSQHVLRDHVVGNIELHDGKFVVVRLAENAPEQTPGTNKVVDSRLLSMDLGRFCLGGHSYAIRRNDASSEMTAAEPHDEDLAHTLTERELQIAALVAGGRLNKQIALQLRISEHTVSSYLNRIFSKLRVRCRSAVAARYATWASRLPRI